MSRETTGAGQAQDAAEIKRSQDCVMGRKQRRAVTIYSALVVCVAFFAITIARNNYNLWSPEFFVIELVVALLSSLLASRVTGMEERGFDWAAQYLTPNDGLAFKILRLLPVATCRAAIMTACLSVVNATVVPMLIYRETVAMPVLAVPIRFLADIPQGILLCLTVLLVVDRRVPRDAEEA
ncbi:MAG: hypothetical protein J6D34_00330 [Atopobiaceae bacterium]|nr:hypothetical protein [Atopobiaceae bacterium]